MIQILNDRLGEINTNKHGTYMKIIEYNSAVDITVEFQDEYRHKTKSTYRNFKNGGVYNPYDRAYYNMGYTGYGKYKTVVNGKKTLSYIYWSCMLQRCYDIKFIKRHDSYMCHTVCDEWLDFQNFSEWFYDNYYKIGNEKMNLENNILLKGNTEYSPENSIFAPQRINNLFVKMNKSKDRNNLIGTTFHKASGKWRWQYSYIENGKYKRASGSCNSEIEAFMCYKEFKENYIKQVADEYEKYIPRELYKAMYEYEIEITD